MKKSTYILGYIAAFASVLSLVFKINHWPLTSIVLVVALLFMSIFLFFYITDKMSESTEGKILPLQIIGALSASLFILSVLFKFEHWPFASILLALGIGGFSIVFLPLFVVHKAKKGDANTLMNSLGAAGVGIFAIAILLKLMHWPGPSVLFPAGAALLFLFYFPMYMMSTSIPPEQKHKELRDIFFAVIIACFLIIFALGIIGLRTLPNNIPPPPPPPTEEIK